ncbi:hypothetical protein [Desulfurobacterium crinifex]
MSENTILGIICTIIAIALPLSFAILAWKHTLEEKKKQKSS